MGRSNDTRNARRNATIVVVASNGGSDRTPEWWLNLQCRPHAELELDYLTEHAPSLLQICREGARRLDHVVQQVRVYACHAPEVRHPARIDLDLTRMHRLLEEGARGDDATVATFCANVLELEPALWNYVKTEGVDPTNNFMERLVRRAVLWRKRSFGSQSEAGCRFVERMLTVVQTLRLQKRPVWDYLVRAIEAHRSGLPAPQLLGQGGD